MTQDECRKRISAAFGFADGGLSDDTKLNGLTFGVVWRIAWDAYKAGLADGKDEAAASVGRKVPR